MLVATACVLVLVLAVCFRAGAKDRPMDRDVVRRIRRFADQNRREQVLPYE